VLTDEREQFRNYPYEMTRSTPPNSSGVQKRALPSRLNPYSDMNGPQNDHSSPQKPIVNVRSAIEFQITDFIVLNHRSQMAD
jgi:hypothetical protein